MKILEVFAKIYDSVPITFSSCKKEKKYEAELKLGLALLLWCMPVPGSCLAAPPVVEKSETVFTLKKKLKLNFKAVKV